VQSRGNKIISYFAFPRLGIAIPLQPGDIVFLYPNELHCVRSRVENANEISCMSLYEFTPRNNPPKNIVVPVPAKFKTGTTKFSGGLMISTLPAEWV
jgi:hypothetical protein